MLYYTIGQWRIFIFMLLAGMTAGLWYETIRAAGRFLRAGPWLNAACDILTALGIWLIVTAGLMLSAYGEVRLYALMAASVGFFIERMTVGHMIVLCLRRLAAGGKRVIAFFLSLTPVKKILK